MLLLLCVMWRMEHKPTRVSNFEDFPQTFDSSATFSHVLVHPPPLLCSVVVIVSWHLAMIREIIWAVHGEWGEGWAGRSGKLAVIYTEHCTRKIAKKKQKQHRERSKEFFFELETTFVFTHVIIIRTMGRQEDAEQTFTSFSSWFSKALWRSDIESNELMKQMKFRGKSCKVPARSHASLSMTFPLNLLMIA